MPRFAANISMLFAEIPFIKRSRAAAENGFAAVECHYPYDTEPEHLRVEAERAGVRFLGINTPVARLGPEDSGIGANPQLSTEADARFAEALDYAIRLNASAIHVKAGRGAPGDDGARAAFVRHLRHAGDSASAHGLTVLIEPLNPIDSPGYFLNSSDQAAAILNEVDHPAVRMMFDIYHVQIIEGDLMRRLERHLPLIGHIQIAAAPDRGEPDDGEIAYGSVLDHIDRLGYSGWIGAEYRPRGTSTIEGLGWMSRFRGTPKPRAAAPLT